MQILYSRKYILILVLIERKMNILIKILKSNEDKVVFDISFLLDARKSGPLKNKFANQHKLCS